jgi:23S rRNA pseudouridine1911/1915/1917 synthase
MHEIRIKPNQKGQLLLEALAGGLGLSRKKAKALLDSRVVFVNKRRIWMARHPLQPGDLVTVRAASHPVPSSLKVVYEDDGLLVLNKPAGLLSNGADSAESALRKQKKQPGLTAVHRLDRDTSGCLLFAKTPKMEAKLVELFRTREVTKVYQAIVVGRVSRPRVTINEGMEGKSAFTRLQVLDIGATASHLKMTIGTGRTHQIRRHCASIDHPVLGDKQYGAPKLETTPAMQAERQMLHARRLTFTHPATGKVLRVEAPLPPDYRSRLKRLGLT